MSAAGMPKTRGPKPPTALVIHCTETGIALSCTGIRGGRQQTIRDHDTLLQRMLTMLRRFPHGRKPDCILVLGRATRFSHSRSVATIANLLSYALDIPVASLERSRVPHVRALRRISRSVIRPIRARYTGPPHVTKHASSRRSETRAS